MCAWRDQKTVAHCHGRKKEDIIVRRGTLRVQLWPGKPGGSYGQQITVQINGEERAIPAGGTVDLESGERITLRPGVYHEFWPISASCVIGEVSTANDDRNDNCFDDPDVGRFPEIDEDESPLVRLIGEPSGK
jgi:hypothetical protein